MESEEEQHMTTLLCMGFSDPAAIRRALRLAKNDINEAVALLTNERPGLHYEPMDSGGGGGGQGGGGGGGSGVGSGPGGPQPNSGSRVGGDGDGTGGGTTSSSSSGGFDPPPAYHEVVENEVTVAGGGRTPLMSASKLSFLHPSPPPHPRCLLDERSGSLSRGELSVPSSGNEHLNPPCTDLVRLDQCCLASVLGRGGGGSPVPGLLAGPSSKDLLPSKHVLYQ